MQFCESLLDLVGNTPLVRLDRIGKRLDCHLLAKCEFLNAGGSVKDRPAVAMVDAAEKAGWPDLHGRGRFKYGWDATKRRGIMTSRYIHVTTPGKEKQALERAARAMELQFDYYGPFGFGAVVARLNEPMFDLNKRVTAEMLREREIAIQGSKQFVIDKIMKMKTECGYEDFSFLAWFELGGFEGREVEDQMQLFAEEVMPVIARECGGKVELPDVGIDYLGAAQPQRAAAE